MAKRHLVSVPSAYAPPVALVLSTQAEPAASSSVVEVPEISLVELSSFLRTAAPLDAADNAARVVFCGAGAPFIPFNVGIIAEQLVMTPGVKLGKSGAYPRSFIMSYDSK
jgi:hypothetical protein